MSGLCPFIMLKTSYNSIIEKILKPPFKSTGRDTGAYFIAKEVSKLNQVYEKENFIVIPVGEEHLVINKNKIFKEGHINVRRFDIATLLIDLAINKQLPIKAKFVDSLITISVDKNYIRELEEFKQEEFIDVRELMSAPVYRRYKRAIRQVR